RNNAIWDDTQKYSHLAFQQYLMKRLWQALYENVFHFLNNMLRPHEVFGHHTLLESVIGEPDFIQKDSNEVLLR
ncbi:2392_t:CDS:1, partial [Paraglomus occultum]